MSRCISFLLFLIMFLAWDGQPELSFAAWRLGDTKDVSGKSSVFILEPQIYAGRPAFDAEPFPAESFIKSMYLKAINEAGEAAFSERGYRVDSFLDAARKIQLVFGFQQAYEAAWERIIQRTRSRKFRSDETDFFNIAPFHIVLDAAVGGSDLLVFTQIYAPFFPDELSQKGELAAEASAAAGSVAVQVFAMNAPFLGFSRSGEKIYCKMSVFDAKSGNLVWYRYAETVPLDLRSKKQVTEGLKKVYKGNIPKALVPYPQAVPDAKFKKKRSELNDKNKIGT